jgi:hypothetical protein
MSDEHLTDGWEPDLPVSDTLLRRFLFNLAAFHEVPAAAAGARTLRRDDFTAADLGRPAAMHNAATLLRPLPGSQPPPPGAPPGLRVERVAGVDGLRDWERVAVDGFPYRELQPWRPGALLEELGLPAVGVFSDMSRPSAEALGFLPITRFTLWHRPRPARSR